MTTDDRGLVRLDPSKPRPTVAVIGGGIAGITSAIKLARRGYAVTLFEKADVLGGNLSSNSKDNKGGRWDVYPHIFGDWYNEFWHLLREDFGIERKDHFKRRPDVRMALIPPHGHKPETFSDVTFATVKTPTTLANLYDNCYANVLSPRDMFLFGYTYLDLVSVPATNTRTSKLLGDLDVTGYLYSRPFMNNEIAEFHDDILKVIWSMPSDMTSARAYQKLIKHTLTFPRETPFAWLINGPLGDTLMQKIEGKLEKAVGKYGGELSKGTEVLGVRLSADDTSVNITFNKKASGNAKPRKASKSFDYAVIATPARTAGNLALGDGSKDHSLVGRQPGLARLREARMGRIPVVYLYFHPDFLKEHEKDLKDLPDELTGFKHKKLKEGEVLPTGATTFSTNNYDVSIHNIASVWGSGVLKADKDEPVLVVAASRATAITAVGPEEDPGKDGEAQGLEMLNRLHDYFPFFKPGTSWGDRSLDANGKRSSDVNWDKTRVITNEEHQLFLNDTGSNHWRPRAKLVDSKDDLLCKNVFFAGEYCLTDVDMATVEAAVQSGVLAAQTLQWEHENHHTSIRMRRHTTYSSRALLVAKLATMPAAFWAAVSAMHDDARTRPENAIRLPYEVTVLAAAYWFDALRSAGHLAGHMLPGSDELNPGPVGSSGRHDRKIGIIGMMVNLAVAWAREGREIGPIAREAATDGLYEAWHTAGGRILYPDLPKTFRDKPRTQRKARERTSEADTWPELLQDALSTSRVPSKTLSDVAFGVAASTVHVLKSRPGTVKWRDAVRYAAKAYKERDDALDRDE